MPIFGAGLDVGLALLLAGVFLAYAKIGINARALGLTVAGALLYLLGGVLAGVDIGYALPAGIFQVVNAVGTIAVVIGILWAVVMLVTKVK